MTWTVLNLGAHLLLKWPSMAENGPQRRSLGGSTGPRWQGAGGPTGPRWSAAGGPWAFDVGLGLRGRLGAQGYLLYHLKLLFI
jgi:hypothetical protein